MAKSTVLPPPIKRGTPAVPPSAPRSPPQPKVSAAANSRMTGIRMIVMSVPLLAVSSYILYKRMVLGEEQKKQEGFISEDGIPVKFSDLNSDSKQS
ncbi:uncharacterized protein V1513DRAFT_427619 [Lipomyces chichibuensis]|uniref:uncharacterized protein n=1 Tax=Lipomyces chichibuensis TaxID=1546026 RepID=UPI0033439CCF